MSIIADKIAKPTPMTLSEFKIDPMHKILDLGEWSDRKTELTTTNGGLYPSVEHVRLGFKMRPMRDGAGKPSLGTLAPDIRPRNPLSSRGEDILQYCLTWGTKVDLHMAGKTHPFPQWFISGIEDILSKKGETDCSITQGQPFKLKLIKQLLRDGGDPDYDFMDALAEGLNIGVEDPIPPSPGIWPTRQEMSGGDYQTTDEDEDLTLKAMANYSSADEYIKEIEATYIEEKALDMVLGPFTQAEAAAACDCREDELITGAMGANIEADKIRPIFDASVTKVNGLIQLNTPERTTAPGLADGAHGAKWSHRNIGWQYSQLGCLRKLLPTTTKISRKQNSKPPHHKQILTVLKSDVSKAHRRCMIRKKDWRYQVATIGKNYWINKVGTYGVASAQTHWGRTAAAIVRLLYYLFPDVDWIMIFVDDIIAIMNKLFESPLSMAIMATLYAIGCPMAWHKTSIGHHSTWVGFEMELEYPRFRVAVPKLKIILAELTSWIEGKHLHQKEILKTVSRIQWATAACPMAKPFLQQIWAWMTAVTKKSTGGRPSKSLQQIAKMLMKMLSKYWFPDIWDALESEWHGASDASRRDDRSGIGGWIYNKPLPDNATKEKGDVWWFMEEFDTTGRDSWLYHGATPRDRVAPMELYGTLILLEALWSKSEVPSTHMLQFKVGTDNLGNSMSVLNNRCKTWPSSIILMQMVWSAQKHNIELGIRHVYREGNKWADQLAGGDAEGFDPNKRLTTSMATKGWDLLEMFTTKEALNTAITKEKRSKIAKAILVTCKK